MSEQTKFEKKSFQEAEADGIIEGRNAVIEALRSETAIDKIYLAKGETDKTLGHIASKARAAGIVVVDAIIMVAICTVLTIVSISFVHAITARLKIEQVFKFYWTVVTGLALISLVLAWYGL